MVETLSAAVRRTHCWQRFRVNPTHFRRKIVYGASDHLSQKLSAPATTVSLNRLAVATMRRYSPARTGEEIGSGDMDLHHYRAKLSRAFTAPTRCPHCGDLMVAPVSSEFVEGGEIRHHWECDSCGEPSSTSIPGAFH
jgi:predicted RNA-binding Zn-ribbon protein involved in translation (DUF1610 family)